MAIKLEIAIKGVPCNYWKIIDKQDLVLDNKTKLIYGVYADDEAKKINEKENIMMTKEIMLVGLDKTRGQSYQETKLMPYFEGAKDC